MTTRRFSWLAPAFAAVFALSACSTGPAPTHDQGESAAEQSQAAVDSADGDAPCTVVPDGTFPVEIEHAFGTTTIEEEPERIATVGWYNHEVPIALGVTPVGITAFPWGDDDGDGIMPWVDEELQALGGQTPVLFDDTDGTDFEAIAATEPDVILAAYSGLSPENYQTLSKIAPTIAYPDVPWGTSMWDMICMNSKAIGLSTSGAELAEELRATAMQALDENPELKDKKILFTLVDPSDTSQITYYTLHDTRPGFLYDLGLPQPEQVVAATEASPDFFTTISAEQADVFDDVDIFVVYADSPEAGRALVTGDPLLSKIPAVKNGHVVVLTNNTPLTSSANPSPLSISWGVSDYFALLNSTTKSAN